MMGFRAEKCGCKNKTCQDWHVAPVAAVQGVGFSQKQAEAVAKLLNDGSATYSHEEDKDAKW